MEPPRPRAPQPPAPVAPPSRDEAAFTNLAERTQVKPVAPGIFEIGRVRLNKPEGTVSFPAVANMERGAVEFLLVTGFGRTHESVLRSDVDPYQIHLAMLLLGARGNTHAVEGVRAAAGPTETPYGKAIGGDRIGVEVAWKSGDREVRRPGEELVMNLAEGRVMSAGEWTYTGSVVVDGVFLAQVDGSLVAVMREPAALVNNPREGAERDEIWGVNTNTVPALDTPVEVTFRLRPGASRRP